MLEYQNKTPQNRTLPDRVGEATNSAAAPRGCISKKEISNYLYPNRSYRSNRVRQFLCTADRLQRCRIKSPDELKRIRIFSPEATQVILSDLEKLGFIK